jgi:hypothetical protein
MKNIIYSVSLLFGILIISLIILYYDILKNNIINGNNNLKENYEDYDNDDVRIETSFNEENNKNKLNIVMTSDDLKEDDNYTHTIYENDIVDKYKISSFLNSSSLKMLISSYETRDNIEKIQHFQWIMDIDNVNNINKDIIVSVDDKPKTYRYPFNPTIYGYNIKDITVEINNKKDNSIINELAVFFNLKFNDIKSNTSIGQLICINNYDYQTIFVNIVENNKKFNCGEVININDNYGSLRNLDEIYNNNCLYIKKTYDIVLDINSNKYYIKDIGEDILKEPSVLLALIINKDTIHFHINTNMIEFKRLDNKFIIIDYPIYINKNKDCDITLYSAAMIINSNNIHNELEKYNLYNKYNLHSKINI